MVWYYAQDRKRIGPIDDAEFEALIETGIITSETLVWNETLPNWVRCAELEQHSAQGPGPSAQRASSQRPSAQISWDTARCHECGRSFKQDDMIQYQNVWICARCKPIFVQKIKEGARLAATDLVYAGFWIRFLAKFLDGMIQGSIGIVGIIIMMVLVGVITVEEGGGSWLTGLIMNIYQLFSFVFGVFYTTFFLGKFSATPGKMICGLKVVTSDGGRVSYPRALGRHFAEWLSSLILMIGYIMAAFDEEKRALHDRICDTRVIKK